MYDINKSDCPRGFIRKKDGCVPEGTDVSDKLVLKYERYFFKEGKIMENGCSNGLKWCSVAKKCVPEDDVKGKGPIGQPTKVKEGFKLVDIAFDESFEIFTKTVKAEKKVKRILDAIEEASLNPINDERILKRIKASLQHWKNKLKECSKKYEGKPDKIKRCQEIQGQAVKEFQQTLQHHLQQMQKKKAQSQSEGADSIDLGKGSISTTGRPYDHPKKIRVVADVEECGMMGGGPLNKGIAGGEVDPDSDEQGFDAERDQGPERADDLHKHSNDINQVPNQKVKALYQSIRRQMSEFALMGEADKSNYKAYFAGMLKKFGVSSPAELDGEKKKAFFNAVDKGWKGKSESD
jgi:uncharacterized protein (UPF0262 family)